MVFADWYIHGAMWNTSRDALYMFAILTRVAGSYHFPQDVFVEDVLGFTVVKRTNACGGLKVFS